MGSQGAVCVQTCDLFPVSVHRVYFFLSKSHTIVSASMFGRLILHKLVCGILFVKVFEILFVNFYKINCSVLIQLKFGVSFVSSIFILFFIYTFL